MNVNYLLQPVVVMQDKQNMDVVIPAKAGIHLALHNYSWIPTFAGMTIFMSNQLSVWPLKQ